MKTMEHSNQDELAHFPCPVPLKQLPVYEYQHLRGSKFFRWAVLNFGKYTTKLLAVGISSLLLVLLFYSARLANRGLTYSEFLGSMMFAELVVLLTLILLYAGWHNLYSRLVDRQIDYKIHSQKKTEVWHKPKSMLLRDRLIARFQVRPILKRLKRTILLLLLLLCVNFGILFLTVHY